MPFPTKKEFLEKAFDAIVDLWHDSITVFFDSYTSRIAERFELQNFLFTLATTGPVTTFFIYASLPFTTLVFAFDDFKSALSPNIMLSLAESFVSFIPIPKELRTKVMTLDDVLALMLRTLIDTYGTVLNPPAEVNVMLGIKRKMGILKIFKFLETLDLKPFVISAIKTAIADLVIKTLTFGGLVFVFIYVYTILKAADKPALFFTDALQQNNPIVPDERLGLKRERIKQ